jgi:hypothetical protein
VPRSPIYALVACVILAACGIAIYTGFARAVENLRKPATRSGTFRIGDDSAPQKVFPSFGVIVCPLEPTVTVDVTPLSNISDLRQFVASKLEPPASPGAANSTGAKLPGAKMALAPRAVPSARAEEALRHAAQRLPMQRRRLQQTNPPPPPPPPPYPDAPGPPPYPSIDSSAVGGSSSDGSTLKAWCQNYYYTGGVAQASFVFVTRVFGADYALSGDDTWNETLSGSFSIDVATALSPALGTAAADVSVLQSWAPTLPAGAPAGAIGDAALTVQVSPALAPLLAVGGAYEGMLPTLLSRVVFKNAPQPMLLLALEGPYFPGDFITSSSSSSSDTSAGNASDSSAFNGGAQDSLYDYYCSAGGAVSSSSSSSDFAPGPSALPTSSSEAEAGAAAELAGGTGTTSTDSAAAEASTDPAAAAEAAASTTTDKMAPWVAGTVTFPGATNASLTQTDATAAVMAVLFDSLGGALSESSGASLVNLTKTLATNGTAAVVAKLRGVLGSTLSIVVKVVVPPSSPPASGRRLLAAAVPMFSVPAVYTVGVHCSAALPSRLVMPALAANLSLANVKRLLPGAPAFATARSIFATTPFVEALSASGAVPFASVYTDAVLPLFGFVWDVSPCTRVTLSTAAFSPLLRDTFLHPTRNSTSAAGAEDPAIGAQINLKLRVPSGKDVVVGIYETSSGLAGLGSFIILKADRAGLLNYPRLSAELRKTLKPYNGGPKDILAALQGGSGKDDSDKAEAKKKFDFLWKLSLTSGDAFRTADLAAANAVPGASAAATAAAASSSAGGEGSTTFILNLQSYFVDFTVRYTEVRARYGYRGTRALANHATHSAFCQEFNAYTMSDAVANALVYINTAKSLLALLTPLLFAQVCGVLFGALQAAKRGDFKAAAEEAKGLKKIKEMHMGYPDDGKKPDGPPQPQSPLRRIDSADDRKGRARSEPAVRR